MTMSRMRAALAGLAILPGPALGQVGVPAGPPASPVERRTPAEAAMERYDASVRPRRAALPCRQTGEEIVVCAPVNGETSPYRLPLPDERDPGEAPIVRGANPGPPALGRPGVAPAVTFGVKLKKRL